MKNKTRKIITLTSAILLIVLIQSIGVTYAKYLASENATGQAEVAKWAFEIVKEGEQTKNIKLVDTTNNDTMINGKIAPGTSGTIILALDGTGSDVDLDYTVEFINEQNKPKNLKFRYGDTIKSSLADFGEINGKIEYDQENKKKTIAIFWEWAYETGFSAEDKVKNDEIDTQDANNITEYTFDVLVTATQSEQLK